MTLLILMSYIETVKWFSGFKVLLDWYSKPVILNTPKFDVKLLTLVKSYLSFTTFCFENRVVSSKVLKKCHRNNVWLNGESRCGMYFKIFQL